MSIDPKEQTYWRRWYIALLLFLLLQIIIYVLYYKCVFMSWVDWIVLMCTLAFIVGYGIYRTRRSNSMEAYLRGNNENRWWEIGLSVMATGFGHHFPVHTRSGL